MARVRLGDQKLTLAIGKKKPHHRKMQFSSQDFQTLGTSTIFFMHFFQTFVYSYTLQTFLSHLHNLFRVRHPSSAPYLKPMSNDWHSVGIDGRNCGQRLFRRDRPPKARYFGRRFNWGSGFLESPNDFYLVRVFRVLFDTCYGHVGKKALHKSNNMTYVFYLFS